MKYLYNEISLVSEFIDSPLEVESEIFCLLIYKWQVVNSVAKSVSYKIKYLLNTDVGSGCHLT
jgi:hypothetical protein